MTSSGLERDPPDEVSQVTTPEHRLERALRDIPAPEGGLTVAPEPSTRTPGFIRRSRPMPQVPTSWPFQAQARAWDEQGRPPDLLLSADDLAEAQRSAEGRGDLSAEAHAYLLQSGYAVLKDAHRRLEEQRVQEELSQQAADQRLRRRLGTAAGAALLLVMVLSSVIALLVKDQQRAHGAERQALRMRDEARGLAADRESALVREAQAHQATKLSLQREAAHSAELQRHLEGVREIVGRGEAKGGAVTGSVEQIFKKRIASRGSRSADTGVSKTVVDQVLLHQGWPLLRRCLPAEAPLPAELPVTVVVDPSGAISEAQAPEGPAQACLSAALRGLRFPSFEGAHFVRVSYRFHSRAP